MNMPEAIPDVSVNVRGSKTGTTTNENGEFRLKVNNHSTLVLRMSIWKRLQPKLNGQHYITVPLKIKIAALQDVTYSTGYQKISSERSTGSFAQLDSAQYSRRAG